jgi:tRNA pseudouridine32 synthase / 23S rRNA pseudouridine746 synthase
MYDIVENTPNFVVVYKKPGSSFHSESGSAGLFETIKQNEGFPELFPVHRLDKVTSGLLVMAKNAATNQALTQAFSNREIEKYYLAISTKKPLKKQGLVKGDMASSRRGAWKLVASCNNPAITQFFNKGMGEGKRLFIVKPYTGKTHQIRVALKSLGSPILGDELYAGHHPSDRTYLHAYSLAFSVNNQFYRFTELPREGSWFLDIAFSSALGEWAEPWNLPWPVAKGLP